MDFFGSMKDAGILKTGVWGGVLYLSSAKAFYYTLPLNWAARGLDLSLRGHKWRNGAKQNGSPRLLQNRCKRYCKTLLADGVYMRLREYK